MIRKGLYQMRNPKIAAVASAVALALTAGQAAQAVEIKGDSWNGSWDTTISLGSSWRMEERDISRIGHANLAILEGRAINPLDPAYTARSAWSNNNDDSNINFDDGDPFSRALKFTTEFGLEHDSGFGFFMRGTGVHDFEIMKDAHERPKPISNKARKNHGKDYRLLDAYMYYTMNFEETSLQWRLGQQVISWGESTFIQHGLSEINAIDVTKLRVPGSEIKEGLIPVETLWASMDLSDTLSLEAYVQFEWEKFRTDEPGTYFAAQDFAGETGESIHLGFGIYPEGSPGTEAYRIEDRDAKDDGQFGIKLAWLAEDWNYTEFGFYYVNYHNKRPLISANAWDSVVIDGNPTQAVTGFFEYLEDIQMYGLSFNTATDGGMSIAGEMTYRKDEPLQIDDVELLFATLEPIGQIPSGTSQIPGGAALGDEISGYRLFDTVQLQATFTKTLGPTIGADQWVVLLEVGANMVLDMPEQDELRFEAPGTYRSGNPDRIPTPQNPTLEGVTENAFADDFSWGYRFVTKLDYTDVIGGWNMSPRIVLQHDVSGITPGPISNFIEDRKAITLGLGMDYQAKWKADIGYSVFTGAGTQNVLGDRDFLAVNVSYSF